MKFYGNLDLNQGQLMNACFASVDAFPASPLPGQVVFKDKRVFVCTETEGSPTWIPITNELDVQVHTQSVASSLWEISYTQTNTNCLVQVFDVNGLAIIPNDIDTSVIGTVSISFTTQTAGKAVIIHQANSLAAQSTGGVTIIGEDGKINDSLLPLIPTAVSELTNDLNFISSTMVGSINGLATLDGTGKITLSQVPSIAITDTFVVETEAAMLALVAETGDLAIRTDISKTFILAANPASTLSNWKELSATAGGSNASSCIYARFSGSVSPFVGVLPHYPKDTILITNIFASVSGVAVTTISARVNVNGSQVQLVTIPVGQKTSTTITSFAVTPSDYLTVDVIGGTGENLSLRLDY